MARKQPLQRPGGLQERCRSEASGSVAGALRGPRSNTCSAQQRCSSAAWPQKQQLQRLGAVQQRCVALEATFAASESVAGALRGPSDVEQVPGSFWGKRCDVEQVQDRSGAGFATLNRYQLRSLPDALGDKSKSFVSVVVGMLGR